MSAFIDQVTIRVQAGSGGDGCSSFRREKFVPRGGPDGGDGGAGGDVVVRVDPHMRTLLDLRYRQRYRAERGVHGQGKNMTGANGEPAVIMVPAGTVVEDADTGKLLADLTSVGEEVVVARGGRGGKGNFRFRSATVQAPRKRTFGEQGEERRLRITLKLIADVGLVGLPNAGKSTLLKAVSDAHPVIADYPFSTLTPVLGIVKIDEGTSFCMVDIPGLIEGAHEGKGLGIRFLQHIERCRVLVIILDVAGPVPPEKALEQLLEELRLYSPKLLEKPRLIAVNKMDMLPPGARRPRIPDAGEDEIFKISALTGKGVRPLVQAAYRLVLEESRK